MSSPCLVLKLKQVKLLILHRKFQQEISGNMISSAKESLKNLGDKTANLFGKAKDGTEEQAEKVGDALVSAKDAVAEKASAASTATGKAADSAVDSTKKGLDYVVG